VSVPLLQARALHRVFDGAGSIFGATPPSVHAVNGVDVALDRAQTLGIVGESGCGKSTLARMLVGLDRPSAGSIAVDGRDIAELLRDDPRALLRLTQYVFQDPVGSLNPRKTVRQTLATPLRHLLGMTQPRLSARVEDLMDAVGLRPDFLDRYPHELSGGQAQRVGIARALAAEPRLIVLDEPVSALDVSVQAQVLNLLGELKAAFGLTYVFISHDLAVIERLCDTVAVMYFGRVVELAPRRDLFATPRHPYTRLLFDSIPVPGRAIPREVASTGELPDPTDPPSGCAFAPRCARADDRCKATRPELAPATADHRAACFHPLSNGTEP